MSRTTSAAQNFVEVAEECGVKKIIYLGGLGELSGEMSQHLKSRKQVGDILAKGNMVVIRLRAAIILGTGSASYELLKSLVVNHRLIPFINEFNSWCQPIAIRDVIKYLVGVLEVPGLSSRIYNIGGQDKLLYKDLILQFARILGKRVRFVDVSWVPLPVEWLCRLYACWLHVFTAIPINITSLLLSSLKTDVVCHEEDIRSILPFTPLDFNIAVTWAQEKEQQFRVFSHWTDVPPDRMSDLLPLCEFESANFVTDQHCMVIPASAPKVFELVCRIGGKHGWAHANLLWDIRGWIDRSIGGVGLHRGRRDENQLRLGDSVDFWRVEKLTPDRELLLRAEMISPGLSWLQFQLEPVNETETRLILTAHFIPKPFWGQLDWTALSKFHTYIFEGMLQYFHRQAMQEEENIVQS